MISEKALRGAAVELQKLCQFDPPIDVKAKTDELIEQVKEAIAELKEDDVLTPATQAVVDELKEKTDDNPPSLTEEVEAAETRGELIEIAKANDEFKSIRGALSGYKTSRDLKAAMIALLEGGEEPEEEPEDEPVVTKGKPVAKPAVAKPAVTKERFAPKKSTGAERVAFLTPLIQTGKFTKAELVEKASAEFPDVSVSTLQTLITDSKNPKYNKFAKLVVQSETGILSFSK